MMPREPRNERDAYVAARERAQELSRFARLAMTQDTTPVRSRTRSKPTLAERLDALWSSWDTDMRVGMAGVACLFALGAILRVWG